MVKQKFKQGDIVKIKRNANEITSRDGFEYLPVPSKVLGLKSKIYYINTNERNIKSFGSCLYQLDNCYWVKENMIRLIKKGNMEW